ncbi:dienelactone hydrolase family protein [Bradyrhizobium sp. LHD-71]|uniref:dienelactone hydrolase family protein n=1 Tax=Bradyrhizobium sp. LHD-71 TaxID=3072141 RepID=UPI00280E399D|nr:dienelactone hydrolase family protein [Bradyrhizobium sp. LHD-71]MDQ8730182.1 dienelactone hydrolase family protein [Bradyrhizobium sp. LHD-71]
MGQDVTLTSSDGFKLGAYRADPKGAPKGAIVVIQEIFGVNHHIRAVVDRLADEGYVAIAPAVFDRMQPNFQTGYTPDDIATARTMVGKADFPAMLRDTQAAIDAVKSVGPVGITGFCMGGTITFLAAAQLSGLKAAVAYYGGQIAKNVEQKPKVATMMHFGEKDAGIPMPDVETIKAKHPDAEIFVYDNAQHGFHCDERASYDKKSADAAWKRTMDFFAKHLK